MHLIVISASLCVLWVELDYVVNTRLLSVGLCNVMMLSFSFGLSE